jgi:hypothetical protein
VGQVPEIDATPIGIVGDGRVARHFRHYLSLLGRPVRAWSRRASTCSPAEALSGCRTIAILISDGAIVPFVEAWPELRARRLVHFSGSLVTPLAAAAHPLMTFGTDLYDLDTYRTIPFVMDRGGPGIADLFPGLPNPSYALPAAERPFYHALCVLAGNCSTLLWTKFFEELQTRFGIPAAAAHPYLSRLTSNLLADAGTALTGPLARGDTSTIAANLRALEGDPFHAVYAAFVRAYDQRA